MILFDPELQLINTKPTIKSELRELLNKLRKLKLQTKLVSEYKKINDRKIFHSNAKATASNFDIDEAFKSMHESVWIVSDVIIKIFEC